MGFNSAFKGLKHHRNCNEVCAFVGHTVATKYVLVTTVHGKSTHLKLFFFFTLHFLLGLAHGLKRFKD